MVDLVLGIAAAVGASTLYSLGIALQAMDAKEAPHAEHLRLALAWRLVRRARWLLGTGLSILGWPLQLVALLLAPLVVVQPALAAGLLVLMFLAQRMLRRARRALRVPGDGGDRDRRRSAPACARRRAQHQHTAPRTWRSRSCSSASASRACSPTRCALLDASAGQRDDGRRRARGRLERRGDEARVRRPLAADTSGSPPLWALSTAAASGVGVLSEMSALQARPAIQVAPVVFVTQTVVPIVARAAAVRRALRRHAARAACRWRLSLRAARRPAPRCSRARRCCWR